MVEQKKLTGKGVIEKKRGGRESPTVPLYHFWNFPSASRGRGLNLVLIHCNMCTLSDEPLAYPNDELSFLLNAFCINYAIYSSGIKITKSDIKEYSLGLNIFENALLLWRGQIFTWHQKCFHFCLDYSLKWFSLAIMRYTG